MRCCIGLLYSQGRRPYRFTSTPDGADVYSDGAFVGNTPSTLKLAPGKHTIRVTASGHKEWSREITVQAGSDVKLNAVLEKE
jgi:hypothetical protein